MLIPDEHLIRPAPREHDTNIIGTQRIRERDMAAELLDHRAIAYLRNRNRAVCVELACDNGGVAQAESLTRALCRQKINAVVRNPDRVGFF
jgi:hypothetical protein